MSRINLKATLRKYRTGNERVERSKCQNNVSKMVKENEKSR